jgi:hypothetical protein
MARHEGHREIGLRWREDAEEFDGTIEYHDPDDRGDQRQFAREPIRIDTVALTGISDLESYGRRLTEMVLGPIEEFYRAARAVRHGRTTRYTCGFSSTPLRRAASISCAGSAYATAATGHRSRLVPASTSCASSPGPTGGASRRRPSTTCARWSP